MATPQTFMLALLIPLIYGQITTRECVTERECEKQNNITADQIDCTGTRSCQGASLTSLNRKNGYIDCSGYLSCNSYQINKNQYPSILTASSNIYCSGYQSCWRIGEINSNKNIYCTGTDACMSDSNNLPPAPLTAGNNMYCYANNACYGSDIQIGKKAFCGGLQTCKEASITGGIAVHCDAQIGCLYTELSDQRRFICCAGSEGCLGSVISNVKEIRAYGYQALSSARINGGVETIKGYGAYSLSGATIDTDSDSIITIQV